MKILVPQNIGSLWEGSWLSFLLGEKISNVNYYGSENIFDQDALIVANANGAYESLISRLMNNGRSFGVLLLSDETLVDSCEYVNHENCKFVIRNYFHPSLHGKEKIYSIGLGYKNMFHAYVNNQNFIERKYIWNFVGSVHHENRMRAIELFNTIRGGFVHRTQHFNSTDYLSTREYAEILSNSLYTLCPYGHVNVDTFRLYEALEAGSIPVVPASSPFIKATPSYWHFLFKGEGNLPFIICDTWDEGLEKVQQDLRSGYTPIRKELCRLFWKKWKATWKYEFNKNIAALC